MSRAMHTMKKALERENMNNGISGERKRQYEWWNVRNNNTVPIPL